MPACSQCSGTGAVSDRTAYFRAYREANRERNAAYQREYVLRKRRAAGLPDEGIRIQCADCTRYCKWPGPYCDRCAAAAPRQTFCVLSLRSRYDGRVYVTFQKNRYQRKASMQYARLIGGLKMRRPLTSEEVVHHINADKADDRWDNLEIMPSRSAHASLHAPETLDRRDAGRLCAGCGVPIDERTRGCRTCSGRHSQRIKYGTLRAGIPLVCARCGVPYDERTHGCEACRQRHYLRRKKAAK